MCIYFEDYEKNMPKSWICRAYYLLNFSENFLAFSRKKSIFATQKETKYEDKYGNTTSKEYACRDCWNRVDS